MLTALRQAGNQATGRALARKRETAEKADAGYAMAVAGIGEIAIQSWRLSGPHDIEVTFADGPAGPAQQKLADRSPHIP